MDMQHQLSGTVQPQGLEEALDLLRGRRGLWYLLQQLLQASPRDRITSEQALSMSISVQSQTMDPNLDGAYLQEVLDRSDMCWVETIAITGSSKLRPLHFVATFAPNEPLGLILSEAHDDNDNDDDARKAWQRATFDAVPGEVFVNKGIVQGGQAEALGVVEVGDRLQGVGELRLGEGGFEKAVAMVRNNTLVVVCAALSF